MLVLLFEKHILPGNTQLMQYALISFMIIPVIYITVLLKKTSASYISCVVFMSVTVSHAADVNPYLFAINRMIDTLIGIAVAYGSTPAAAVGRGRNELLPACHPASYPACVLQ